MRTGNSCLLVGGVLAAACVEAAPLEHTVVLDNFEVDPYTHFTPPDNNDTIVYFPTTATPGGWYWRYQGYGTPASGDRNTSEFFDVASWHFFLKEAANLEDPNPSDDLTGAGPILLTRFNRSDWEPRTLDQIISDLGEPKIDWAQPTRYAVRVKARWDTVGSNSFVGSFSEIVQGLLIARHSGSINVADAVFEPTDNDTWKEATIDVLGKDSNGEFYLGMFGRVEFTATTDPLKDRSPALDFYFDDFRILYSPLRLENVAATSPVSENGTTTLSGDIPFASAATSGTFDIKVDWGDGSPLETFTYANGTTTFSESHQYLDDDPSGTSFDVYTVALTLEDDDGSGAAETSVTVNNVPPVLADVVAVAPTPNTKMVVLNGMISDVGTLDTFTLSVDWGDGGPLESFPYAAGTGSFSESHTYTGALPTTISVTLTDDDTGSTEASTPVPFADLSISKTDNPDPVLAGANLIYTLTVDNGGPADAESVVVTDTLPDGVTLLSTSGCAEDPNGAPTCSLGTIAAGANKVYTLTVSVDAPLASLNITNDASVTSDTTDPDTANNTANTTTAANDGSGVDPAVEAQVPGYNGSAPGDGDGNGVPDNLEPWTASIPSVVGDCWFTVTNLQHYLIYNVVALPPPANPMIGAAFPCGLLSYQVALPAPGAGVDIEIYMYPPRASFAGLGKTGPFGTVQLIAPAPANGGAKSKFGPFRGEDGGRRDDDGQTDGIFSDPVGPIRGNEDPSGVVNPSRPVPTLLPWALGLLGALLGLFGWRYRRRG